MDTADAQDFEDEIEEYLHGLKRYMKMQGINVKSLAPQVADPTNHVQVQVSMIGASKGIPVRILMGSERGELASSQDEKAWNDTADVRRKDQVEPWVIRPFIDKMVEHGLLSDPGEYDVVWEDLQLPSEKEKAEVAKIVTEALAKYASTPGLDIIFPPELFLELVMGMKPDQIEKIIKAFKVALAVEEIEDGVEEIEDKEVK